jgi:RNA polymerase Rpb3/Rpb11 dimerisation domain
MYGVDPPIANAFRRILLAEVPTMAIEHVYMYTNTSIIQDEVLSHRLGLIPILADPDKFDSIKEDSNELTDTSAVRFGLNVCCEEESMNGRCPEDSFRFFVSLCVCVCVCVCFVLVFAFSGVFRSTSLHACALSHCACFCSIFEGFALGAFGRTEEKL